MMSKLYVAKSSSLSPAWVEVFFHLLDRGITELAPAVITISDFDEQSLPRQIPEIQAAIDAVNKQASRTIGSTIFPNSLWTPEAENNAARLYGRYQRIWKTIAKCPANNKGVYFRRLTAYQPEGLPADTKPVNQLDHIIETFQGGNHRHSALQAAIFDPTRDHTHNRRRGFPCLQQVAFEASGENLEVTGFYALQHHVPKAYGNYLGLCWLGRFMAHQMGLRLSQVTCIASSLKLGDGCTKSGLAPLKETLDGILARHRIKAA
jgi:hypothetical protein